MSSWPICGIKLKNNFMEEKDIIMEDKELNEQESLKLILSL